MPALEEKGGVVKAQDTLIDRSVSSKVPRHVELESSLLGWNPSWKRSDLHDISRLGANIGDISASAG
jgi:hypothetical protein